MKTKLFFFLVTFLFAFGMKAQEDTIYFSNLDGEWSIVFDFQGKADTFDLTQNEQGQWFIVADFDLDGSLDTQAVAGPQVAPPTDPEPPVDEPEPTEDNAFNLIDFLKNAWGWILANLVAIIALLEIIVRLTPTERDNNILRWLQSILDAIVPNRKKGGGKFVAFDDKESAPKLRYVVPKDEEKKQ